MSGDGRSTAHREFRDASGRSWTATESPIPRKEWTSADEETFLAGYGVGWLCFQSAGRRRRHRLYPRLWQRLSDAQLEQLCLLARDAMTIR